MADCCESAGRRVPRPPNAFMLYANENRKNMAYLYPADSNKEISKRLGQGWKALSPTSKHGYFQRAKTIDTEHKRKYPDYVYNPKEARIRKALREAVKEKGGGGAVSATTSKSTAIAMALGADDGRYPPLSRTEYSQSPELFANSARYHRDYIVKYFQSVPEYDFLNVTTEDGLSFPYVTIPKMRLRQGPSQRQHQWDRGAAN